MICKCNLLSVPEIDIIGASEVFNGNDNEFELIYYKNASKKYDNLSMDVIKSFCIENNINSIEKVNKIKIRHLQGWRFSGPITIKK